MQITRKVELTKGGSTTGTRCNVKKMSQIEDIILNEKYSLGIFEDNNIVKANFIEAHSFALDFDGGYSLEDAKKDFKNFRHIIATTKSHQKKKHGIVDDRFRVVLFFTERITENDTFKSTVKYVMSLFPKADRACSNSNRWFYQSTEIIQVGNKGKTIDLYYSTETNADISSEVLLVKKGKLSSTSKGLLRKGLEPGNRNNDTYGIAKDFQCNGYSEDEAIKYIVKAYDETETLSFDFTEDEVTNTIRSAYASELTAEPRSPFKLKLYKDIEKETSVKRWVVDKILSEGGFSLLTGVPKAGKSHIARQLVRDILTKRKFFGRDTKYGEVHYFALEEQMEDLTEIFKHWKLPNNVPLYIHAGDHNSNDTLKDLKAILLERKPVLVVLDTLFDIIEIGNENSYGEVKKALRKLKQVARDTGTHILCVHHANKAYGEVRGNFKSILGSQAIIGGVDAAIMIEMEGATRVMTSTGRRIKSWFLRTLIWDEKWEYYTLGPKYEQDEY